MRTMNAGCPTSRTSHLRKHFQVGCLDESTTGLKFKKQTKFTHTHTHKSYWSAAVFLPEPPVRVPPCYSLKYLGCAIPGAYQIGLIQFCLGHQESQLCSLGKGFLCIFCILKILAQLNYIGLHNKIIRWQKVSTKMRLCFLR